MEKIQLGEQKINGTSIVEFTGSKPGIYLDYSTCLLLKKVLTDFYNEKIDTGSDRKKYEYLSYLKHLITKYIDTTENNS